MKAVLGVCVCQLLHVCQDWEREVINASDQGIFECI